MDIDVHNLTLEYGGVAAVKDLDLHVDDGESLVLLGQSGCGKTSTMRSIAGLETPAAGTIRIGGETVFDGSARVNKPAHKRNIGMVFQSYAIWPHMTVFDNVAFPLTLKRMRKAEIADRVGRTLEMVGLASLSSRGASMLSGGQMQRVALARSLVMQPSVLLLDEPLSNLDARLRHRLRVELRELQLQLGLTTVYVTHDQEEALMLADKIALMQGGRIVQIGTPHEIYDAPQSASIADFLGYSNILPLESAERGSVTLTGLEGRVAVPPGTHPDGELRACVRAEDIALIPPGSDGTNVFSGELSQITFQGSTTRYQVTTAAGGRFDIALPRDAGFGYGVGDEVGFTIAPERVRIVPQEV